MQGSQSSGSSHVGSWSLFIAGAIAVGAAYYLQTPGYGQSPALLEDYSSWGVQAVYFDAAGQLLPAPTVRLMLFHNAHMW